MLSEKETFHLDWDVPKKNTSHLRGSTYHALREFVVVFLKFKVSKMVPVPLLGLIPLPVVMLLIHAFM